MTSLISHQQAHIYGGITIWSHQLIKIPLATYLYHRLYIPAIHTKIFPSWVCVHLYTWVRDTMNKLWILYCWWPSMAGVVWLTPYSPLATETTGMELSQERRMFAPSSLVIFIKDSVLPWGNLWNEDFTQGRWVKVERWAGRGLVCIKGRYTLSSLQGPTQLPSVKTSCAFCSVSAFSCIPLNLLFAM